MEIKAHWIGLIGVIVGAAIASMTALLTGYVAHRRELKLMKRAEKLQRYEETFELLAKIGKTVSIDMVRSVLDCMNRKESDVFDSKPPFDTSRLDMLVGFYTPEIRTEYKTVSEKLHHLYGEYVDFVDVAEQGRVGEMKEKFIDHINQWTLLYIKIEELKDIIAAKALAFVL
jgi:hypothetical protein